MRSTFACYKALMLDEAALLKRLLYRDGLILILDKPAGLPVHAGPKGGPNLEQYLEPLRFGLPEIPHLAHRLDRDTSGCLVLGRHRKALRRLGKLFEAGLVEKTYWAVTRGRPGDEAGTIDLPLAKRSTARQGWWMEVDPGGLRAVTDYRVVGEGAGLAFLELRPRTGRTHQLRVHLTALGCPILGDRVYGPKDQDVPLHLHARAIALPLYERRGPVRAEAPLPEPMLATLGRLGLVGVKGFA